MNENDIEWSPTASPTDAPGFLHDSSRGSSSTDITTHSVTSRSSGPAVTTFTTSASTPPTAATSASAATTASTTAKPKTKNKAQLTLAKLSSRAAQSGQRMQAGAQKLWQAISVPVKQQTTTNTVSATITPLVFGVPLPSSEELEQQMMTQGLLVADVDATIQDEESAWIPRLVSDMCRNLRATALDCEGLFRVPGSSSEVQRLKQIYDSGQGLDDKTLQNSYLPGSLAGVLKLFFRSLPEPLLTYELYDCFLAATDIDDATSRQTCLTKVVHYLPPVHRGTLTVLIRLLHDVSLHSDVNRMTSSNLAIVFAPGLMRAPPTNSTNTGDNILSGLDDLMGGASSATKLVKTLIDDCPGVFHHEPVSYSPMDTQFVRRVAGVPRPTESTPVTARTPLSPPSRPAPAPPMTDNSFAMPPPKPPRGVYSSKPLPNPGKSQESLVQLEESPMMQAVPIQSSLVSEQESQTKERELQITPVSEQFDLNPFSDAAAVVVESSPPSRTISPPSEQDDPWSTPSHVPLTSLRARDAPSLPSRRPSSGALSRSNSGLSWMNDEAPKEPVALPRPSQRPLTVELTEITSKLSHLRYSDPTGQRASPPSSGQETPGRTRSNVAALRSQFTTS